MAEENQELQFLPCPFCGGTIDNGLTHGVRDKKREFGLHYLVCICGWISGLHKTKLDLAIWFNTRDGVVPHKPEMTVTPAKREISGEVF